MAKKKKNEIKKMSAAEKAQAGLDHFEREKRAYEERTGEKVQYVPPTPVALMPRDETAEDAAGSEAASETNPAEGDSE